ncbi:glycosyltransferase family 2 protein [Selenomonas ruminantium]|uniref:Glycosyl transferase family 2 n=1 Tax=Selenomonas ruminantium TaxID=971 RepID=A0A1H3ZH64_SELRU|nr:glycosyltransferase family 2 protein [Selenomonas ruminantium]SEA22997.1 Glycosyl transferase family 2 [Selenomonas ruminantium]
MQDIKLSVCYMVKNEAENLPISLASVKDAADEIIVVDTGSTDNTKAIAIEYEARVFDFPWQDDFSAPRNFAIEQAKGEWILFLDADESFPKPLDRMELLNYLAGVSAEVVLLKLHNVDTLAEQHKFNTDWVPRIFRRRADLRYRGRIHEHISKQNGDLQVVYAPQRFYFLHTGYAECISEAKCRRDLQIMQQVISEGDWEPVYDYYLTDCYYGIHDYEQALAHAQSFARSGTVVHGGNGHTYRMILECMRALGLPDADMLPWAEEACRMYPDLPEFYAEQGMILCGLGRLDEAQMLLHTALRRYDTDTAETCHASYFSPEVAAKVAARLGEIADLHGEKEKAAVYFVQALDYCSTNKKVLEKAKKFLKST